jgi:hypothetical protein
MALVDLSDADRAKGEQSAQLICQLKADMAKKAAPLLDGTGWLPEPLQV